MTESGSPQFVSIAFPVPIGNVNDTLRSALGAIDSVHLDGVLPRTPVVRRPLSPGQNGYYDPDREEIVVSRFAAAPALTFLHEVGHVIDLHGLGRTGIAASATSPELGVWRDAMSRTQAVAELERLAREALSSSLRGHLLYLRQYEELWARSYAQHIVVSGGDLALGALMSDVRIRRRNRLYVPYYWDDDDFESVNDSLYDLWRGRRWIP